MRETAECCARPLSARDQASKEVLRILLEGVDGVLARRVNMLRELVDLELGLIRFFLRCRVLGPPFARGMFFFSSSFDVRSVFYPRVPSLAPGRLRLLIRDQRFDRVRGVRFDDRAILQPSFAITVLARQQMPATRLAPDDFSGSGQPESFARARM